MNKTKLNNYEKAIILFAKKYQEVDTAMYTENERANYHLTVSTINEEGDLYLSLGRDKETIYMATYSREEMKWKVMK